MWVQYVAKGADERQRDTFGASQESYHSRNYLLRRPDVSKVNSRINIHATRSTFYICIQCVLIRLPHQVHCQMHRFYVEKN